MSGPAAIALMAKAFTRDTSPRSVEDSFWATPGSSLRGLCTDVLAAFKVTSAAHRGDPLMLEFYLQEIDILCSQLKRLTADTASAEIGKHIVTFCFCEGKPTERNNFRSCALSSRAKGH